jgi:2-amino-4-hydroxy-6-hydroxymethyldihydropteridine diphosphokinase
VTGGPVERAVIALGSNLGDREATIRVAVRDIDELPGVRVVAASGLVESGALKLTGLDESAPRYLNAVILADVTMTPLDLLDALHAIEQRHGRVREAVWGDRTLDADLIAVGSVQKSSERLTLPHPRAWQRSFVLTPWAQIDPDAALPGHGRVTDLIAGLADEVWEFPAPPLLNVGERTPS